MKTLENLQAFEQLNAQELEVVTGGSTAPDSSKRRDVDSDSQDSFKKDVANPDPVIFL